MIRSQKIKLLHIRVAKLLPPGAPHDKTGNFVVGTPSCKSARTIASDNQQHLTFENMILTEEVAVFDKPIST
jgi:hypothetical protein